VGGQGGGGGEAVDRDWGGGGGVREVAGWMGVCLEEERRKTGGG